MCARMRELVIPALFLLLTLGLAAAPAAAQESHDPGEQESAAHAEEGEEGHEAELTLLPAPGAPQIVTSLITLLIFAALVAVLGKYAWGPIVAGLKAREDKIRSDIDAAERARAQADAARRQFEDQLATAETRVRELINQAQADGQQVASRLRAQAQEEAEEIKGRALREIEQSQREALEQIRSEAATLATAVAEKILRREVNQEDQRRLIEESLDEFQTVGA